MSDIETENFKAWVAREFNGAHYTQRFRQAYVEAIRFTDCDGIDDECGPDDEFAPETWKTIHDDCERFISLFGDEIAESSASWEQAAHDFWLTRNGHGAGFWDRPELYGDELAHKLTESVGWRTDFPNQDVYLGDDGLVYLS